ncbi:hypothetical protein ZWY2020_022254 [Hordeum vulgare]|nr:hypothetical protein ZWY2020_022254 [Hordeum vulgare]
MGLVGCILQEEYDARMKAGLVFFFATTMSFGSSGSATGVWDNSPTALVVVGLHNATSAGLLHYMALIELLAADFLGPKLHGSVRLQLVCLAAVLLGVGAMPRPSAILLQASAACFPDPPPEHHFQPDPARSPAGNRRPGHCKVAGQEPGDGAGHGSRRWAGRGGAGRGRRWTWQGGAPRGRGEADRGCVFPSVDRTGLV